MSLREKTISGAKWSAIATVIIIGLGLVQMTVLARIIDNHQFGLLTVFLKNRNVVLGRDRLLERGFGQGQLSLSFGLLLFPPLGQKQHHNQQHHK